MALWSRSGLDHILGLIAQIRDHHRNLETGVRNGPTALKTSQDVSEPQNYLQDNSFFTDKTHLSVELWRWTTRRMLKKADEMKNLLCSCWCEATGLHSDCEIRLKLKRFISTINPLYRMDCQSSLQCQPRYDAPVSSRVDMHCVSQANWKGL